MKQINYIIHDSVHIQYNDKRGIISQKLDLFKKDYDYFHVEKNNPNLIINIGKFSTRDDHYLIENDEYIINKEYLSGRKTYKIAKFEYSIEKDSSGIIHVNINSNLFANRVFHHLLLDNLINIMMYHKGYSNLHCSGIEKNHEAILISGPGGAGKTSFALYCLNKGYRLLGDDRIFVKNSSAYPFPECPGVESNNVTYVKKIINSKAKFLMGMNKLVNIISLNYVGALFSMKSLDMFPKKVIGDVSKVKSIIFLQPSNSDGFSIKKIDKEEIVKKLYVNQLFEDKKVLKDIFNYSTVFPENQFASYVNLYPEKLLKNLPEDIVGYELTFKKKEYGHVKAWLDDYL